MGFTSKAKLLEEALNFGHLEEVHIEVFNNGLYALEDLDDREIECYAKDRAAFCTAHIIVSFAAHFFKSAGIRCHGDGLVFDGDSAEDKNKPAHWSVPEGEFANSIKLCGRTNTFLLHPHRGFDETVLNPNTMIVNFGGDKGEGYRVLHMGALPAFPYTVPHSRFFHPWMLGEEAQYEAERMESRRDLRPWHDLRTVLLNFKSGYQSAADVQENAFMAGNVPILCDGICGKGDSAANTIRTVWFEEWPSVFELETCYLEYEEPLVAYVGWGSVFLYGSVADESEVKNSFGGNYTFGYTLDRTALPYIIRGIEAEVDVLLKRRSEFCYPCIASTWYENAPGERGLIAKYENCCLYHDCDCVCERHGISKDRPHFVTDWKGHWHYVDDDYTDV
jgi:hypothetical protein